MTDFKKQLIALLEREIPELADKIQAGAIDAQTRAPFAALSVPEETPVRTLHGIAGYRTMFEVAVYDSRFSGAERLKRRAIAALEGTEFDGKRCRFVSSATEYYADYDLHGATMSFRII